LSRRSLPTLPGSSLLAGAHHPHCSRHISHLIWVGRRPLCLGCTCMATGAAIGTILLIGTPIGTRPYPEWLLFHAALVSPTALQPWVQRKLFKICARMAVGIASATWLLGAAASFANDQSVWHFIGSVAFYTIVAKVLLALRERRPSNPCQNCPEGAYPTCTWNLPRLLSESSDPELARALSLSIEGGQVYTGSVHDHSKGLRQPPQR
jgi:hypothetical protein